MFGRDPIMPIAQLLEPKLHYYGDKGNFLCMDTLYKLYSVVAENIRRYKGALPKKAEIPLKSRVNVLVLVKDPGSAVFQPKYQPKYHVTAICGNNYIEGGPR